jgi:hypothetical protein
MSAYPAPQGYSVTDLAADLDRQRIRPDARIGFNCDSYANTTDDDSAWALPPMSDDDSTYSGSITTLKSCSITSRSRTRAIPARSYSPTSRSQRQSNTRMLCASQHHAKDIAELVSRMVSSSDQCAVISPPDALPRNMASDDEVDDEGYTSAMQSEISNVPAEPQVVQQRLQRTFDSAGTRARRPRSLECRCTFSPDELISFLFVFGFTGQSEGAGGVTRSPHVSCVLLLMFIFGI